jgi:hypothetical protein
VQVVPAILAFIAVFVLRLLQRNDPGIALSVTVAAATTVALSTATATEQSSTILPVGTPVANWAGARSSGGAE